MTQQKKVQPHVELACYFWYDILGNEEDPWSDFKFKQRILRHASDILKQGADMATLKLALKQMVVDGLSPYSIKQCLEWRKRGSNGQFYYDYAEELILQKDKKPPVYDRVARLEWELMHEGQV